MTCLAFKPHRSESDLLIQCCVIEQMELPFWLADGLRSGRQNIVSVDIPKIYKEGYREIMKADPFVLDLHKLGPHFYEFGRYLMKLSSVEGEFYI